LLRLFVPRAQFEGGRVRIVGAELRHLRTLRLGAGGRLVVFDDAGDEHEVRLERLGGHAAEAVVLATHRPVRESSLDLVLAPALLKGAKMELVIEKATELGVRRIAPVLARHAIGQPPAGDRLGRWRRIALAAAKQSGRTRVPELDAPAPLAALVQQDWPGLRLIAWEGEHDVPLAALPAETSAVVIVVGPEGGLADDEVADARAHGFTTVTLAPRILRAETAALAAVALCQHRWGDLSGSAQALSTAGGVR
jgi:16S rRNA (uracil1498-N3)-methyltransferase